MYEQCAKIPQVGDGVRKMPRFVFGHAAASSIPLAVIAKYRPEKTACIFFCRKAKYLKKVFLFLNDNYMDDVL
ncbi:MAG: hypothetical protein LBR08_06595 [Bacteroidales bacterium]|jgi:hypothetical protein|nr:hypothetical protein [Bacteroidales bacterium]